jgi:hypothetical protein
MSDFIEVTLASLLGGRASAGAKKIVATAHILTIHGGVHKTTSIKLVNNESLSVMETYDDLKALLKL